MKEGKKEGKKEGRRRKKKNEGGVGQLSYNKFTVISEVTKALNL